MVTNVKKTEENAPIKISYFSDILCVWAYVAHVRLEELKKTFTNQIAITPYHVTLFGDTYQRIAVGWEKQGGYSAFGKHVQEVCREFPELEINPNVWKTCRPTSSGVSHLFLKAIQMINNLDSAKKQELDLVKLIEWEIRLAFFRDARDISDMKVLFDIARRHSISKSDIEEYLNDGTAMALFCSEMAMKDEYKLEGSPTYLLNNNRQKLYGNVGYKIIEANVMELIANRCESSASWC